MRPLMPWPYNAPQASGWHYMLAPSLHPHPIHVGRHRRVIAKGRVQRPIVRCGLASCSSAAPRGNRTPAYERGADPKGITARSQVHLNPAQPSQMPPRSAKVYTPEQQRYIWWLYAPETWRSSQSLAAAKLTGTADTAGTEAHLLPKGQSSRMKW